MAHLELARLERAGIVKAVITQNIDLLHSKAGSSHVIEIHGSPRVHRCLVQTPLDKYASARHGDLEVFFRLLREAGL